MKGGRSSKNEKQCGKKAQIIKHKFVLLGILHYFSEKKGPLTLCGLGSVSPALGEGEVVSLVGIDRCCRGGAPA